MDKARHGDSVARGQLSIVTQLLERNQGRQSKDRVFAVRQQINLISRLLDKYRESRVLDKNYGRD